MAKDRSIITEMYGSFYLRVYSSVSAKNGTTPVRKKDGTPWLNNDKTPKVVQQNIFLCKKDNVLYRSEGSDAVVALAAEKREQLSHWEAQFANAAVNEDGTKKDPSMLITDFVENVFLKDAVSGRKKIAKSTIRGYKQYYKKPLKAHFAGKRLNNYDSDWATDFLKRIAPNYAPTTLRFIQGLGSSIFQYAIETRYIRVTSRDRRMEKLANPWAYVDRGLAAKYGRKIKPENKTHAYTVPEFEAILTALTRSEDAWAPTARMVFATCFLSGLRRCEANGLRWQNVHLNDVLRIQGSDETIVGSLNICEEYLLGESKGTKTGEERIVPLVSQLRSMLMDWRAMNHLPKTGWVFPGAHDGPVDIESIGGRIIRKILKEEGCYVRWRGLYACRRGHGTELANSGSTGAAVGAALGNTEEVANKAYIKSRNREAVKAISRWQKEVDYERDRTEREGRIQ